jgi:hypothetical protein
MATMPAFWKRTPAHASGQQPPTGPPDPLRAQRNPFLLRPLPQEGVYFHCKKIDNSRLVRETDPHTRGATWSVAGACLSLLAVLALAQIPNVLTTLEGYRLENLRTEERRYLDERRALELQEATLLSPERLEKLAQEQNLVTPSSRQVIHLDSRPDGAVAMVH